MRQILFAGFIGVRCVSVHSRIAGCRRRGGQVRPHGTAPRHGGRGAVMTPAGLMTGGPSKRTGGVAGSLAFMAVPCDICPRVGCPAAWAAVRQSAGTTERPAADSRSPLYASVAAPVLAGPGGTKDQGFGQRFAAGITPAGTGCRRPYKQHGAHRRAAREICPASAQRHWPADPGSRVSSPQPARTRRRTPTAALTA